MGKQRTAGKGGRSKIGKLTQGLVLGTLSLGEELLA
jgi:hypothetical protein